VTDPDAAPAARIPVATYRLQFNATFRFTDAAAIADYLHALGISDCYASSYLKAVPGSGHGYDVADPTRLNPEVGSDEEYGRWVGALRDRGMGHVLDLVPNHMGIAKSANPWWLDVLENGPSSPHAQFFDIDWQPVKAELADKVLLPILGDQYGLALERQELTLAYDGGTFSIRYYDDVVPIAADTYGRILRHDLDSWLAAQRLAESDGDELRSIAAAAEQMPPRSTRDPEHIAARAQQAGVVKRRLAALVERSAAVRVFIEAALARFNGVAGEPLTFDLLDDLLGAQSYRLAHWRVASEEINYRRFFDINQLAALRMEDPLVFDEVHRFAFELVARGAATGLRVDHVDGLFAPANYLRRLQARAAEVLNRTDGSRTPLYLVVEKILGPEEQLPADWPVHGATGYEFAATVNNLFVDGRHERAFDRLYTRFAQRRDHERSFEELSYRSQKLIMHETMSGDINSLGHRLARYCEANRYFRDFTLYALISTLKDIIASFPVYRTYVTPGQPISSQDRRHIALAARRARRRTPSVTRVVLDFVEKLLLREAGSRTPVQIAERDAFIGKFQQTTSPVAAKGIEDTAFYVYNRLLSLNEVGADPTRFGLDPEDVHRWMNDRRRLWPAGLSATSTHDTKRGEDVRGRLNVLSEIPGAWQTALSRWRALNRRLKKDVQGVTAPDPNEEYFIYQTLVGAWPFAEAEHEGFAERVREYLVKALREAKVHTTWLGPNEEYEAAVLRFVTGILDRRRPFLGEFLPFQARVAELGIYNSLAQLLVKITAPGVPDFYQGTELWDLTLVDPDNRRPVDYAGRRRLLESMAVDDPTLVASLLARRADGHVKLFATTRALHARTAMRRLFEEGAYLPLPTTGSRHDRLFAFARRHGGQLAVTCVPRLIGGLLGEATTPPLGPEVWGDTVVQLPASASGRKFRDVFTDVVLTAAAHGSAAQLDATSIFERFPIALLVATD
jgi:(1->4)-alpha-D-glucan 1-alpha-D-glucosylmutase